MSERMRKAAAFLIGLVLAAILVVLVEGTALYLVKTRDARTEIIHSPPSGFEEFRLTVGYRPQADAVVRAIKRRDGDSVYDVAYTFDDRHRRVTPGSEEEGPCIAFFGGSFAFGEGLMNDETLPARVAAKTEGYRVLNYGFSGYGPQQAVAQLTDDTLWDGTCGADTIGVYVYIPHHVRRAIGSMRVVSNWGLHFPYYTLDDNGEPTLQGSFERDRRRRTDWYRLMAREPIMRLFETDWPIRLSDDDYRLTAAILAEAAANFEARFASNRFYILLYPQAGEAYPITPYLKAQGLNILDYRNAVDMTDPAMTIANDGHPTAKAHDAVAQKLLADLAISPSS